MMKGLRMRHSAPVPPQAITKLCVLTLTLLIRRSHYLSQFQQSAEEFVLPGINPPAQPYSSLDANIPTTGWSGMEYASYAPYQQPPLDQLSPVSSNAQHQQPSASTSSWNEIVEPTTPGPSFQTGFASTSAAPSSQYMLDVEPREGDALSIHARIPPSIPGAMYFGDHLIAEFSQEADGTMSVHVHLPAGYAHISSTFVRA